MHLSVENCHQQRGTVATLKDCIELRRSEPTQQIFRNISDVAPSSD